MPKQQISFVIQGQKLRMVDGELFGPEELVELIKKKSQEFVETGEVDEFYDYQFRPKIGDLSDLSYIGPLIRYIYKDICDRDMERNKKTDDPALWSWEVHIDESEPVIKDGKDIRDITSESGVVC
jgi:hypothetical protein